MQYKRTTKYSTFGSQTFLCELMDFDKKLMSFPTSLSSDAL